MSKPRLARLARRSRQNCFARAAVWERRNPVQRYRARLHPLDFRRIAASNHAWCASLVDGNTEPPWAMIRGEMLATPDPPTTQGTLPQAAAYSGSNAIWSSPPVTVRESPTTDGTTCRSAERTASGVVRAPRRTLVKPRDDQRRAKP